MQSLLLCLVAALLSCGEEPVSLRERALPPPNIVFLLADDLGIGDLGCYNAASRVPTPRMDRIAGEGLRFTDAHSPSAVCSPTRYALLTGRYAWRTRLREGVLWGNSRALIDPSRRTVASLLKARGYHTACFGKWHLGFGEEEPVDYSKPLTPGPLDLGFDEFLGIPASLDIPPYVYVRGDRAEARLAAEEVPGSDLRRRGGGGFWRAGAASADFDHAAVLDRFTDEGIAYLERRAREPGTPFFLYLPFTAPHTPWLPGAPFRGKSRAGYYGDFVVHVDHCVGRVADALEKLGLAESTLFIVTSDNGSHWTREDIEAWDHRANGELRGQKADIWEGGHRIPFLARWPGKIEAGAVTEETICLVDLLATCAALAGSELEPDEGEDSYDLTPVLLGERHAKPLREATVHHSFTGHFAIRQGRWKWIEQRGSGGFTDPWEYTPGPGEPTGQLYDLEADPGEEHNLCLDEPEVVERLSKLLERYRREGRSRPLKSAEGKR